MGHVHMSAGTCRGQKRVSDSMELELQVVVKCQDGRWEPNVGPLQE